MRGARSVDSNHNKGNTISRPPSLVVQDWADTYDATPTKSSSTAKSFIATTRTQCSQLEGAGGSPSRVSTFNVRAVKICETCLQTSKRAYASSPRRKRANMMRSSAARGVRVLLWRRRSVLALREANSSKSTTPPLPPLSLQTVLARVQQMEVRRLCASL